MYTMYTVQYSVQCTMHNAQYTVHFTQYYLKYYSVLQKNDYNVVLNIVVLYTLANTILIFRFIYFSVNITTGVMTNK